MFLTHPERLFSSECLYYTPTGGKKRIPGISRFVRLPMNKTLQNPRRERNPARSFFLHILLKTAGYGIKGLLLWLMEKSESLESYRRKHAEKISVLPKNQPAFFGVTSLILSFTGFSPIISMAYCSLVSCNASSGVRARKTNHPQAFCITTDSHFLPTEAL